MKKKIRASLQAFGGFLTAMVIPNMGAFIAWGFITALFIDTGWIPNKNFAELVGPISKFVLPLLLGHTGGKLVHGDRGGVIGALATAGMIVGSDIPMFLGAMIMGPLSAWILKKFDKFIDGKIPAGFEMVVNNFSLGIIGCILTLLSYQMVRPIVVGANDLISAAVQTIVRTGYLPLLPILNEPAKVLFLNNVIDQGIYYPLGMQEALEHGKSMFFMLASNPGPGLGLLLAFSLFGRKSAKETAPGAIIIHFLGGIHEIYFPYVLMKPITILGMIGGAMSGIVTFQFFDAGLVAGPSPGSIFAYLALTPKGKFLGVIAGVAVAAIVSFLINSLFLKMGKETEEEDDDFMEQQKASQAMKQEGKDLFKAVMTDKTAGEGTAGNEERTQISFIAFACDAGLGSSAMGANAFRKRLEKEGITKEVKNFAIEKVPQNADIIVTHESLFDRAVKANPGKRIITIKNFMRDFNLDMLLDEIKAIEIKEK
ncbi:PTS mannitol transporter subunit IICB [Hespellia stercorisuis]|uniref:PTS system mannitol-specific EIICB component n=1 Tax=Hespellia stercorisuis DSM 15480 TaxID=1121950 RepID=A0A1M6N960_9FIRM|nr:PTS mannitol transporter subunit IICB [Hespellia stercorisuis]SHJ92187.1 PTS system D-mannitol-specific IIB component, Fru family (TC 4.A.2.1.5)/PTS system D-mannitol-specific IIC component, Fru family (TC 4.A.2.1.5) [Hespellia stercorisuis DSM 15480]